MVHRSERNLQLANAWSSVEFRSGAARKRWCRGADALDCQAKIQVRILGVTMAHAEDWIDIGSAAELSAKPLGAGVARNIPIAVSYKDGQFGVVSNVCNHVGGPLGEGRLDGDYILCPWHGWKFHRATGVGEPGFEADCVPAFPVKVEGGRVLVDVASPSRRTKAP